MGSSVVIATVAMVGRLVVKSPLPEPEKMSFGVRKSLGPSVDGLGSIDGGGWVVSMETGCMYGYVLDSKRYICVRGDGKMIHHPEFAGTST